MDPLRPPPCVPDTYESYQYPSLTDAEYACEVSWFKRSYWYGHLREMLDGPLTIEYLMENRPSIFPADDAYLFVGTATGIGLIQEVEGSPGTYELTERGRRIMPLLAEFPVP